MAEPTVCPGRENTPWRKARIAYAQAMTLWETTPPDTRGDRPAFPELQPSMGEPVWCGRCQATIRRNLAALDDLAALAAATADGMRATGDQDKVTGTAGSSSPSPVQDMLDQLYADLTDIEVFHRDELHYSHRPQRGTAGAHQRSIVIAWLLDHLTQILTRPGAHDNGTTILSWHARLQAATRSKPDNIRVPTRCPRCQLRSLRRKDDGYIHCDNQDCGRILSENEHEELAEQQAIKESA